jgi:c-di-GMP-related signal transduction protein
MPATDAATPTVPSGDSASEETVMIARQPIFDSLSSVYGYELLFRSSADNRNQCSDPRLASRQTVNRALHFLGLQAVVGAKKAFVNFTAELLLEGMHALLPPNLCVIELPAAELAEPRAAEAFRKLRGAGFELAVDVDDKGLSGLPLELADYLKIDFRQLEGSRRRQVIDGLAPLGKRLIAQKVETREEFQEAMDCGCKYAQGYFFCKPEIMVGKQLVGSEIVYMELMRQLNLPEISYDAVEQVIKRDASLAMMLLRYLNSAAMGLRNKINSIQRALVLLGENTVRKWGTLVVLTNAGRKRPTELLVTSLVRARFCEAIGAAEGMAQWELDLFLAGLLSLADAIFEMPMDYVLDLTAVSEGARLALLESPQAPPELSCVLGLAKACERGAWGEVVQASSGLKLTQSEIAVIYYDAMMWADQSLALAA